jgi:hypothetical protein
VTIELLDEIDDETRSAIDAGRFGAEMAAQ